jgi:uncharacterized spore protein YtfJ
MSKNQQTQTDGIVQASNIAVRKLGDIASASTVFGAPVQHGDVQVIPCAEVFGAMGSGGGSGHEKGDEGGEGGGGGGVGRGRPVAAIVITPHGVRVEPVLDSTKVWLAALTTLAFILAWLSRLTRATHNAEEDNAPSFNDAKRAIRESERGT